MSGEHVDLLADAAAAKSEQRRTLREALSGGGESDVDVDVVLDKLIDRVADRVIEKLSEP